MITRTECLEVEGLVLDVQFTVLEDVNVKMELIDGVRIILLNGTNIVNIVSEDFKEKLIELYYKSVS